MNRKTLKELNVDFEKDLDALEILNYFEERDKIKKCIKGLPLSIKKQILKDYSMKGFVTSH
jgi:hypothetical protein